MTTPTESMRRLNRMIAETDAAYHEIARGFGVSDSVLKVLYVLCDRDGECSVFVLRRESGLSKQTLHSALRLLEKDGHLVLHRDEQNRRNKTVRLTPDGRILTEKVAGKLIETENRILSSFTKADLSAYFFVGEQFLRELQKERIKEDL